MSRDSFSCPGLRLFGPELRVETSRSRPINPRSTSQDSDKGVSLLAQLRRTKSPGHTPTLPPPLRPFVGTHERPSGGVRVLLRSRPGSDTLRASTLFPVTYLQRSSVSSRIGLLTAPDLTPPVSRVSRNHRPLVGLSGTFTRPPTGPPAPRPSGPPSPRTSDVRSVQTLK